MHSSSCGVALKSAHIHVGVLTPAVLLRRRCFTGFKRENLGACAATTVAGARPPSMDSELYQHCYSDDTAGQSGDASGQSGAAQGVSVESRIKVDNVRIAPCISLDSISISTANLGVGAQGTPIHVAPPRAHFHGVFQAFLGCLVRDVASFMTKLFDMAKQAVSNIINTVKGWIQASIDWAIRKIQELWSGITGAHRPPCRSNPFVRVP